MLKKCHVLFTLLCFDKVLKSRNESEITHGKLISQTSCSIGWFPYGDMCYRIGGGRLTWEDASERCHQEHNGNLVAIHSQGLADFLAAFFLMSARQTMWIGLHDRFNESEYTWDDGSPIDYENWDYGEPSGQSRATEDCVEFPFRYANSGKKMGKWNDGTCDQKLQFICQRERGNFNSKYSDPRFCSPELGGGWSHLTSCFHFVNESKTWSEAEEYCVEKFNGHLVTIPDLAVDFFLSYILRDQDKNLWIGIRKQTGSVQQWSSGWQVAYENYGTVFESSEESCAARSKNGQWSVLSCTKLLPFVCEHSIAVPPTLQPSIEGSSCPELPDGWRDLGGDYCYYVESKSHYSWYQANFLCMKRGGSTLLSIHSPEEVKVLHNFIKFQQVAVYIGLYRQHDNEFAWADGSPMNFKKWDSNEPSSLSEECGEMRTGDMKWNDVECKQLKGYICSIPKVLPNQTHNEQEESTACSYGISSTSIIGVVFCVVFVAVLFGVVTYYCGFCERNYERMKKTSGTQLPSPSYRNPKDKSELIIMDKDTY